ncbi:MerR family transcriptional regulator [Litoreibacter janthinus]|uniref:Transcriptional regulator, MerR family n=1 Tax=Litoreibacter janthinus TaxID=670154 RepID=A0A1I6GJC9_9RHOB|nr:MerR family DNA-binding transcriptional regulator [Litoreibacter janthinus]SFR42288.1 transcriptional regulator, MerR family [Litoreibacter janthinus]
MTSDSRLTFKEMCAKFDVTPRTLRYYEYIELLSPERDGRARFYHPREVARMKLIMRGRKFGFSLEDIRQWLDMYNSDHQNRAQMEAVIKFADKQMGELQSRRQQIEESIKELQELREQVAKELLQNPPG